jgi:hypothetical protein
MGDRVKLRGRFDVREIWLKRDSCLVRGGERITISGKYTCISSGHADLTEPFEKYDRGKASNTTQTPKWSIGVSTYG